MPSRYKLGGFKLGLWVNNQRTKQDSLSPERSQRLNDIGLSWNAITEAWEEGFSKLQQFKESEGHCRVPNVFKLDGYNLGNWVGGQRRRQNKMSSERKKRLDDIGFIWDAIAEAWEEGFSKLLQFKETEGHCRVPHGYKLEGFKLGNWVRARRDKHQSLSSERKQRLDEIGFVWDPWAEAWEEGFSKLLQFKESEGHCLVPATHKLGGFRLGQWVMHQRIAKDSISTERKQRLDALSFIWDPLTEQWEEGFSKLLQFKETEGHCRVPHGYKLEGFKLGIWVSNQRANKDKLSPERKQRLADIGFIWDASKDKT